MHACTCMYLIDWPAINERLTLSHAITIIYCIYGVEEVKILKMLFIIIYSALFLVKAYTAQHICRSLSHSNDTLHAS